MPKYMLCSAKQDTEGTYLYAPSELISKYPTPAKYVNNRFLVFGERPKNTDDFTIYDLEDKGYSVDGENGLTPEEFQQELYTLLNQEITGQLVYVSSQQIQVMYDMFKEPQEEADG